MIILVIITQLDKVFPYGLEVTIHNCPVELGCARLIVKKPIATPYFHFHLCNSVKKASQSVINNRHGSKALQDSLHVGVGATFLMIFILPGLLAIIITI